jgi:DNA-binding winged helix-turn-helix (wHTH) protein
VRLGSRAFDILAALVERAGEVVGKEQLIARAWPQMFVEESNLKIQVSALRRALGEGQSDLITAKRLLIELDDRFRR